MRGEMPWVISPAKRQQVSSSEARCPALNDFWISSGMKNSKIYCAGYSNAQLPAQSESASWCSERSSCVWLFPLPLVLSLFFFYSPFRYLYTLIRLYQTFFAPCWAVTASEPFLIGEMLQSFHHFSDPMLDFLHQDHILNLSVFKYT